MMAFTWTHLISVRKYFVFIITHTHTHAQKHAADTLKQRKCHVGKLDEETLSLYLRA